MLKGPLVILPKKGFGTSALLLRARFGRDLVEQFFELTATLRIERNLERAAAHETIPDGEIDHQVELFRDQFEDDQHELPIVLSCASERIALGTARDHQFRFIPARHIPPGWAVAMTTNRGGGPKWRVLKRDTEPSKPNVLAQNVERSDKRALPAGHP